MMKHHSLRYKFAIIMASVVLLSLVINVFWTSATQRQQAEREMREKAQVLAQQLDAVWAFMDINQGLINTDSDGTVVQKGLHCSVVGKSIGKIFSKQTDYVIRYTNVQPRKKSDLPDPFEQAALAAFLADPTLQDYYGFSDYQNEKVFRYASPLKLDESCLECHGEPAGQLDVLGYPKEGMKFGDLGGAISIIMPIDLYMQGFWQNISMEILFFFLIMVFCALIIYFAVSKLVTKPLSALEGAVKQVEKGDLDIHLGDLQADGEIKSLAQHFDLMVGQLNGLYSNLESKVEIRTEQLATTNEKLQQAIAKLEDENQYKSDFLAIMSHELRTPLTSIIAFTEIWERNQSSDDPKEIKTVKEIKNNGQILLNMINNILEMARLEAGKLELSPEPVDLVDLMAAVEGVLMPLAAQKGISLKTGVDRDVPVINGDWEKLRRIIENLASNAIKFTDSGGSVEISAHYDAAGQQVIIRVDDNGIGIEAADLTKIFDKFVQSDSSASRPYNGSGLGLALAKELAEMHNGSITASSIVGEGSIFTVTIPVGDKDWSEFE